MRLQVDANLAQDQQLDGALALAPNEGAAESVFVQVVPERRLFRPGDRRRLNHPLSNRPDP